MTRTMRVWQVTSEISTYVAHPSDHAFIGGASVIVHMSFEFSFLRIFSVLVCLSLLSEGACNLPPCSMLSG